MLLVVERALGTRRSQNEVQALDFRSTVALFAFESYGTIDFRHVAFLCCGVRICHSDRVAVFVTVDSWTPCLRLVGVYPYWFSLSVVFRLYIRIRSMDHSYDAHHVQKLTSF